VVVEKPKEVDVDEIVGIEHIDVAAGDSLACGKSDAATAAEGLWLLDRNNLGAEASEQCHKEVSFASTAADEHALHASAYE
jgi:hypothetical protein